MKQKRTRLNDGTQALVRAIRPQDALPILGMHERLSPETIYDRYLRSPFTPSVEEIEQLCHLEAQGGALVATVGVFRETIIGLAYYIVDEGRPNVAEVAFLIEDRYQGQGLGSFLFQQISRHAQARGITTLKAYIHLGNSRMKQLIRRSGFFYKERIDYGVREIQVHLEPILV